jgi:hypothetical protein
MPPEHRILPGPGEQADGGVRAALALGWVDSRYENCTGVCDESP